VELRRRSCCRQSLISSVSASCPAEGRAEACSGNPCIGSLFLTEMDGVGECSELVSVVVLRLSSSTDGIGSSGSGARLGPALPDSPSTGTRPFPPVSTLSLFVLGDVQSQAADPQIRNGNEELVRVCGWEPVRGRDVWKSLTLLTMIGERMTRADVESQRTTGL
jgi:hypothetical protein